MRSEVPRPQHFNYRQITASMCKEKFSKKERAYFDVVKGAKGDLGDDEKRSRDSWPRQRRAITLIIIQPRVRRE